MTASRREQPEGRAPRSPLSLEEETVPTSTDTVEHVRLEIPKAFAEVARAFEQELGPYDAAVV